MADELAERDPTAEALRVEAMSVSFPTPRGTVRAVRDVSFSVRAGETLGVVGESGSGKSVLARAAMDLLPRTAERGAASSVLVGGVDVARLDPRAARHVWGREVAMIFQDPNTTLNPVRRIGAQLVEPMRLHLGLRKAQARERALELLRDVGISDPGRRLDQYPHELSGGMRQRVSIAAALSCEPKVLLADEPTTALDVTVQAQILALLRRLQRERNLATVLITHDLGVVAHHTDRVAVMYAGRFVEMAPTAALFADLRHPYTAALLRSIPRIDAPSHTPLEPISGRPPDPLAERIGCAFAPRCENAGARCLDEDPALETFAPGRAVACFHPVGSPPPTAVRVEVKSR